MRRVWLWFLIPLAGIPIFVILIFSRIFLLSENSAQWAGYRNYLVLMIGDDVLQRTYSIAALFTLLLCTALFVCRALLRRRFALKDGLFIPCVWFGSSLLLYSLTYLRFRQATLTVLEASGQPEAFPTFIAPEYIIFSLLLANLICLFVWLLSRGIAKSIRAIRNRPRGVPPTAG